MSVQASDATLQQTLALSVAHVGKSFGKTQALDDVSVAVNRGEVLALLGHNGSGKSTLIKVLAGFHDPDGEAEASVYGNAFSLGSAAEAKRVGLRFVHQDLGIVTELDAVDNIALATGYLHLRSGRIDRRAMIRRTEKLLEGFGVDIDVTAPMTHATPVELTGVAIARALWDWEQARRVLVLDEATAALPSREVDQLFRLVNAIRDAGHSIIYVTHRMDEVFRVADRVVVLRSGRVVHAGLVRDESPRRLAETIAGTHLDRRDPGQRRRRPETATAAEGPVVVGVSGLAGGAVRDVDLSLRPTEIVGVAGLQGSGRDELPYLLTGATKASHGRWELDGRPSDAPTPDTASEMGIAFVPADRARQGLIAEFSVRENLTLAHLAALRRGGRVPGGAEREFADDWLVKMGISRQVIDQPIGSLSGGNQQRVLLAKWFCTNPMLLVSSEPTAGVDVGARRAIYSQLTEFAATGVAIVVASSDVEDLVEISDRVLVMNDGRIARELVGDQIQADNILTLMEESSV